MKKLSLQWRLTLILTGLACAVLLLSAWMVSTIDRLNFNGYIQMNREMRNERIASVLAKAYEREGGWQENTGVEIAQLSELEGLHIHLSDAEGRNIWQVHHGEMPEEFDSVDILVQGKKVGHADISSVDPESYSHLDWHYRSAMTQGLIATVVPVLLVFFFVSWYLSRRIVRPLAEMIQLSSKMRSGDLGVRIERPAGETELTQLADSLNHLSEELQKQEGLRRNLTADVAHELRTPLATLKSHLEALGDGVWEPTKERFDSCGEEVERLIELVASLQTLTQAESDTLDLRPEPTDLLESARSVVHLVEPYFESKGVQLRIEGVTGVEVPLDRDKWKQVLLNLLDNALKYTAQEGTVTMRVGPGAVVQVRDTGTGIREEDLSYVFERFYRADKSRNRGTGGAGIGLAIVKKYVTAHGGTIAAESEFGKGTTFTIRL